MDYASVQAAPSRAQVGDDIYALILRNVQSSNGTSTNWGCERSYSHWGTRTYSNDHNPQPAERLGAGYTGSCGVWIAPFNGAGGGTHDAVKCLQDLFGSLDDHMFQILAIASIGDFKLAPAQGVIHAD